MAGIVALLFAACSDDGGPAAGDGAAVDSRDVASLDDGGGATFDAGAQDAGEQDAGEAADAAADAGVDSSDQSDSSYPSDVSDQPDSGHDASDAGVFDTGVSDSGSSDAGHDPSHGTKKGILFTAIKNGETRPDIWIVQPDASGLSNLSDSAGESEERAQWSGDGAFFVFSKGGRVYRTDYPVFSPVDMFKGNEPAISADGTLVAATRYVDLGSGVYDLELFVINASDGTAARVTEFSDGEMENMPQGASFSPDGKHVVFTMLNPDGAYDVLSSDLFIHDIESGLLGNFTNQAKTVQAKVANRSPEWSPDGATIAWFHVGDGETAYYLTPAGGGAAYPIFDASHNGKDGVAWAPDGDALAFCHGPGTGIAIVALDGTVESSIDLSGFTYVDGLSWR